MSADDETRARDFRAALAQGQINRLARARRLAGSATAAANLRRNWQPVVDWQRERDDRQHLAPEDLPR